MCESWPHPPITAHCERCHNPIYRTYRSWFSCPLHMATCFTGRLPMGADLGVRHVPLLVDHGEMQGRDS